MQLPRWVLTVAVLACGLIQHMDAKSVTGDRTLVLLAKNTPDEVQQYSRFIDSLKQRGFQVSVDAATSSAAQLFVYGERQYDHLVLLTPDTKKFAGDITTKALVDFLNNGGNVVMAAGTDFAGPQREFTKQLGVDFDIRGNHVLDHFHYWTSNSADDTEHHSRIVTNHFADLSPVLSEAVRQGPPVLFQGMGHRILSGDQSAMVWPVLTGYDTTYSGTMSDRQVVTSKTPVLAGTRIAMVSVFQAYNNARVVLLGSTLILGDTFFQATVEGQSVGNEQFLTDLTQWAFQEKSVVRVDSIAFSKAQDEQPSSTSNPHVFRVKDTIKYRIELSQYQVDQWVPFRADDVQLEVVMLDPYIRKTLTINDTSLSSAVYTADVQLPDQHGVYSLKIDYKRPGWSYVDQVNVVSVVPFKHDEFDRYLSAAFPYYASAGSLLVSFLVFSIVWLYNKEPSATANKQKKIK
ncbi:oligosaccharyl transferase glycoprotein complex, beta subunit [Dispira simplex]|nr:oligosaccharyl transferase glycoprotein complex, beta subunit [Dispira simplex]